MVWISIIFWLFSTYTIIIVLYSLHFSNFSADTPPPPDLPYFPLYSEHLNLVAHKQQEKKWKRKTKGKKKVPTATLCYSGSTIKLGDNNRGGVQLSESFPLSLSTPPVSYTRLGKLHEERAHTVCSLFSHFLFLSRLLVLFFRLLCNVRLKSALAH